MPSAGRDFTSGASHELRTPTASIKGLAETLVDYWDLLSEQDRRRVAFAIRQQALRLEALVTSTLYLSEIESSQAEPEQEVVHLDRVVREVAGELGATVRMVGDWAVMMEANHERMRELVRRMLANALAHDSGTIQVELREREDVVMLAVGDDASVIPHEWSDVAFRRAIREDGHGGVGFDLPIAEAIVQAQHGRIRYEAGDPTSWVVAEFPRNDLPAVEAWS